MTDVASQAKLPKSDADFGQTFGQWGWEPQWYLMLPIFGPSNERDVLGFGCARGLASEVGRQGVTVNSAHKDVAPQLAPRASR